MRRRFTLTIFIAMMCISVMTEAAFVKAYDIDEITGMYLDVDSLRCETGKRREPPFYGADGVYFSGKFYVIDNRTGEKLKDSVPMAAMYCNLYQGFSVLVEKNVFHKSAIQNVFEGITGKKTVGSSEKEEIYKFYNGMDCNANHPYLLIAECMCYTYTGQPSIVKDMVNRSGQLLIPPMSYAPFRQKVFGKN